MCQYTLSGTEKLGGNSDTGVIASFQGLSRMRIPEKKSSFRWSAQIDTHVPSLSEWHGAAPWCHTSPSSLPGASRAGQVPLRPAQTSQEPPAQEEHAFLHLL